METVLHIHLLGLPRVLLGNSPVNNFPTEKVKLLFFYLILFRGVTHNRSSLAGLFWGDSSETQARHALSTAIWRLRQWLKSLPANPKPGLLLEDQEIALSVPDPLWLDVGEFEEQITRAKQMRILVPEQSAISLQRAVELYRGNLMEGCYNDWCLVERNRLHELYLSALLHLMVYHGERHEYEQAIAYANRILADDPLREEVHRELMKLFVLNQQPAEAVQQFHRCERALKEELGIQPMPETQALFRKFVFHQGSDAVESTILMASFRRDTTGQSESVSDKIERVLRHFESVREELTQAIETLRQTQIDIDRDSGTKQLR